FLEAHVRRACRGALPHDRLPLLDCDGALAASGATLELAALLARLGPFGSGNPEPRFALPALVVRHARVVGEGGHVSVRLEGADGAGLRGIAFRAADTALGRALLDPARPALHLAGTLRIDEWNGGETVCLHVDDAAPAG